MIWVSQAARVLGCKAHVFLIAVHGAFAVRCVCARKHAAVLSSPVHTVFDFIPGYFFFSEATIVYLIPSNPPSIPILKMPDSTLLQKSSFLWAICCICFLILYTIQCPYSFIMRLYRPFCRRIRAYLPCPWQEIEQYTFLEPVKSCGSDSVLFLCLAFKKLPCFFLAFCTSVITPKKTNKSKPANARRLRATEQSLQ